MIYVLIANAVMFSLLFVVWTKKNWLNVFMKLVLLGLCVANVYFVLNGGYI